MPATTTKTMAEYTDKQKAKMVRSYGKKMAMLALNAANGDYTAYTRLYVDETDSTYVSFKVDFYDKNSDSDGTTIELYTCGAFKGQDFKEYAEGVLAELKQWIDTNINNK